MWTLSRRLYPEAARLAAVRPEQRRSDARACASDGITGSLSFTGRRPIGKTDEHRVLAVWRGADMFGKATRRPRRTSMARAVGLIFGVLASGALVLQASQAAFTGQTSTDNHIETGTVTITNERTGQALLNVATLTPGNSVQQCVLVTYNGSVSATVKLYAGDYTDADDLGGTVTIKAETATGGGYGDCANFTASIVTILPAETVDTFAARVAFANGAPSSSPWQPTGSGQTKAYRITATLPSNAANSLQGTSLDIELIWEAQSL
jgi:hypothetical protein